MKQMWSENLKEVWEGQETCGWSRVGEEESSRTGGQELTGTGCIGLRAHGEGLCSE